MKLMRFVLPLIGGLLFATVASAQTAEDFKFTSTNVSLLNERIAELESRLESVETTGVSFGGPVQNDGCKSGKCGKGTFKGGTCWCSPCSGVTFDAELLLLRMADSDGSVQENDYASGSRYTLGYTNHSGQSLRVRYFEYANQEQPNGDRFLVENLDVEYGGRFTLGCNWQGELTIGARWAELFWEEGTDDYDDALGPLAGISLRSNLFRSVDLYASGKQAYMIGRNVEDNNEFQTFAISELAFGVEVTRDVGAAAAFARAGVEAQYYHSIADDAEDVGLLGGTFALGITR